MTVYGILDLQRRVCVPALANHWLVCILYMFFFSFHFFLPIFSRFHMILLDEAMISVVRS